MLTSFFGKSNPVNYLILGAFIVLGYILGTFKGTTVAITAYGILLHISYSILSVLMLLLLDFIIRKNHLTKSNTFAIFFFTCFILMLPIIFLERDILLANAFLILALRRIMSLRSDRNSSKKILDASVWITIASLFYFWSLLFLAPLWLAIIQKPNSSYKQMLIPFTGVFAILLINTAFQLLLTDSFAWFFQWKQSVNFDFSKYNVTSVLIPTTVILGFYVWTAAYRTLRLSSVSLKEKSNYLLMLYVSLTSLFVALLGPEKTGAEILFVLAPISIIAANYIEGFETEGLSETDASEFWFKEIMLWLVLALPFVFLFL